MLKHCMYAPSLIPHALRLGIINCNHHRPPPLPTPFLHATVKIAILGALPLVILLSAWSTTSNNLDDACKVTEYQELCEKSLAPYARGAGRSPYKWALAGLSAAIDDAKAWLAYMRRIGVQGPLGSDVSACVELAEDVVDLLKQSLKYVRGLKRGGGRGSEKHIIDLRTWLSAAVTDGDTCADGFKGTGSANNEIAKAVMRRAKTSTYLVSNAHALVLWFGRSGPAP